MKTSRFFLLLFFSGLVLIFIILYELRWLQSEENKLLRRAPSINIDKRKVRSRPTFAVYGHNIYSGYLNHVFEIFESFGFELSSLESNWDVLWAHDYPFTILKTKLRNLEKHQKVNHFPGTGFITNKLDLAKTDSQYIPKAFKMPAQKASFLKYASRNKNKMFVEKGNDHRGIQIQEVDNLNLNKDNIFIQEYVDKPLLVDGHKFDVGVYTIITSVEPLRLYIYNGDILFRFCPDQYFPFDPANRNKYVIGDDYLPLWELPSLKKYFTELGYSMKASFDAFLRSKNINPEIIWIRIEDAIRTIVLRKETSIVRLLKSYNSKRNFFELIRFDFAIDKDLNVFVMEANMSPNLSSAHFPPNRELYYQVLFNLFSLVGLGEYSRSLKKSMDVSLKNLMVYPEHCSSVQCMSCLSQNCLACLKCLSEESFEYLKISYSEHNRKRDCKRIFPPSEADLEKSNATADYSQDNLLLFTWFKGKCAMDKSWC